jgi:hypothetical protein
MGEELVSLVCGGQRADFALGDLVHLADAREALRLFIAGFPEELPDGWAVDE